MTVYERIMALTREGAGSSLFETARLPGVGVWDGWMLL